MGLSLGGIITVLVIVWWIVSAVIGQVAKKQEQERLQEIARQKRQQSAGAKEPAGEATGSPPPSARQSRLDELRSRREAQLEELRRRRSGAATQPQVASTRPQQPTGRPASPPAAPKRPRQPRPAPQSVTRQTLPVPKPSIATQVRPIDQRQLVSHIADTGVAAREHLVEARRPMTESESQQSTQIRTLLSRPHTLRQMYLIKEILDPPVSLRM